MHIHRNQMMDEHITLSCSCLLYCATDFSLSENREEKAALLFCNLSLNFFPLSEAKFSTKTNMICSVKFSQSKSKYVVPLENFNINIHHVETAPAYLSAWKFRTTSNMNNLVKSQTFYFAIMNFILKALKKNLT